MLWHTTFLQSSNRRIPDSQVPSQAKSGFYVCGASCEPLDGTYGVNSSDLRDRQHLLCTPCYLGYADLPNDPVVPWYAFSPKPFPWLFSFLNRKAPRTLLRAWVAALRGLALHATKQNRVKNTLFGSILWCKATKQQGDNNSQHITAFLIP